MRALFGSDHELHNGGRGATTAAYTRIMVQGAMLVGLRGGCIIDHRCTLGIASHGLVTPVNNAGYDAHLVEDGLTPQRMSRFQSGYGGLLLDPIIAYRSPGHISVPILIGAGGCGYQTFTALPQEFDLHPYHDDFQAFFVLEPAIDFGVPRRTSLRRRRRHV